ncbi:MAG TPA: hypothetical protein VJP88_08770 [Caulobacteraceae bacterium]|nr:hypothetical protein [Caulobacteraceae bacterium]
MTRDHQRLAAAWWRLGRAWRLIDLGPWLEARGMPAMLTDLTVAQARLARRELNAWRGSVEGRCGWKRYPRKERRALRRMTRRREEWA